MLVVALVVQLVARRGLRRASRSTASRSSAAGATRRRDRAARDRPSRRAAATRRPLRRRRARSPSSAARSRVGQRPGRLAAAARGWPSGCARCCPTAASSRCPAIPACATSSARCPGRAPAIVLGAHYDTRVPPARASSAPTTARPGRRRSSRSRATCGPSAAANAREIRFVLFDGEEEPPGCRTATSTGRAARLAGLRRTRTRREVGADGAARLHRQPGPAPAARGQLGPGAVGAACARRRASVGVGAVFPPTTRRRSSTTTRRSCAPAIPAVDLIDFSYRYADTLQDTVDKLSVRSLDAVGETTSSSSASCGRAEPRLVHWRAWPPPPEKLLLAAPARLLRRRRPRRADRRARARAARRARLRAQGDRPQQARRRAAARARRGIRRRARRHDPRGRGHRLLGPRRLAGGPRRRRRAAACRRSTRPARSSRRSTARRSSSPARATRSSSSAMPATRRSRARWARRRSTSCSSRPRPTSTRSRSTTPSKIAYVSQTTLSVDETRAIINRLRERFPNITGPRTDDICYATTNRQAAVKQMAAAVRPRARDRLAELVELAAARRGRARPRRRRRYLIDNEAQVERAWLEGKRVVGISSGASAPEELVAAARRYFRDARRRGRQEFEVVQEDVRFMLPRRSARRSPRSRRSAGRRSARGPEVRPAEPTSHACATRAAMPASASAPHARGS